ncbi:MAG: ABC transporter substrate-binding protein [Thermoleophilaceae bacterium]|nr:ABC transporter substrate-binding protein [Thermoleophilaceae bacterium]
MRIASLVPSATEYLFALGLGDSVVAVTHECDYPDAVFDLPQITRSVIPEGLEAAEVDAAVREHTNKGDALYVLDEALLAEEEPDLIITQELCEVCAVSVKDVRAAAKRLPSKPDIITLDPTTLGEVLADIRTICAATDSMEAGVELLRGLADRVDDVKIALRTVGKLDGPPRPKVVALEWLDPVFLGGHWVPQMIEIAGGIDFLGLPGERSLQLSWDEVVATEPDVVVLMQCGYSAMQAAEEAERYGEQLAQLGAARIFACDAMAYFSRPGPRLIDGLEQLAHALHPTLVPESDSGRFAEVELD